jgi:rhodanese-related sulfurtransferase
MLSYQEYVKSVQQEIEEIDQQTFYQSFDKARLVIDIREPEELQNGIITGAVVIPRGILEAKLITLSPEENVEASKQWLKHQDIVLYCASGARSALAVKSLNEMGLTKVSSLSEGFNAWQKQGHPISNVG